jgi:hypothetical protein
MVRRGVCGRRLVQRARSRARERWLRHGGGGSQTRTVWSWPAEAGRVPSGDQATVCTRRCARSGCRSGWRRPRPRSEPSGRRRRRPAGCRPATRPPPTPRRCARSGWRSRCCGRGPRFRRGRGGPRRLGHRRGNHRRNQTMDRSQTHASSRALSRQPKIPPQDQEMELRPSKACDDVSLSEPTSGNWRSHTLHDSTSSTALN